MMKAVRKGKAIDRLRKATGDNLRNPTKEDHHQSKL
jgi:hypothetical protein